MSGPRQPPLLVIVGPTAVGKTVLSLALAQRLGGEIISADSRLFYRGMDIGTAKPTAAQQARVPHHLLDVCDPHETLTLGAYQRRAGEIIGRLHAAGRLPLLVGGTGQYIWSVVEGWGIPEVPPQPALRAALEQREAHALHAELQQRDPVAAAAIHPHNRRRVIRALEVCLVTNRPISTLQQRHPPPWDIRIIGLTAPRDWLYERIDRRIDGMLAAGLLQEVAALQARGVPLHAPAMSGLGYRQLWEVVDGRMPLEEGVARIRRETRRFVRQQTNWFSPDDARITWVDVLSADYPRTVFEAVGSTE